MFTLSCQGAWVGEEGRFEEDVYLHYQTLTELELPFEEAWNITNGGRTHEDGAHHFVTWGLGQRYAFDAVIHVDGKSHVGEGTQNEDYYCFGRRLNAPGAGVVIALENSIEDNVPGQLSDGIATGNYVMIDHQNGEFSVLAHFQQGTIIVAVGDRVVAGQELGKAGNSGNSTEPHLHYHLQNTATLFKSAGLPAIFQGYYADGTYVEAGEPSAGQAVSK